MILKLYKRPKKVGWLGWIETCKGECVGFVDLTGKMIFDW